MIHKSGASPDWIFLLYVFSSSVLFCRLSFCSFFSKRSSDIAIDVMF